MNRLLKQIYKHNLFRYIEWCYTVIPYYLGYGYAFHPQSLVLYLSYKCNQRCVHCKYMGSGNRKQTEYDMKHKKELTPALIDHILKQASDMGIKTVLIHGGEATINPYFTYTILAAKKYGLLVNFFTNGLRMTGMLAKFLCEVGNVNQIVFSLQGTEQIHDRITGAYGNYRKLMQAYNYFIDLGAQGYVLPDLHFDTVIQGDNQYDLIRMLPIVNKPFLKNWTVVVLYKRHRLPMCVIDIKPEVVEHAKEYIRQYKGDMEVLWGNEDYEQTKCTGLYFRLTIDPYGDVVPCPPLSQCGMTFGNIKESSLRSIWNNAHYRWYRRRMKRLPARCRYCPTVERFERL